MSIACKPHPDNVLRAVCTVTADPPSDVMLTWGPEADPARETLALPQVETAAVTLLWLETRTVHRHRHDRRGGQRVG